MVSALVSTLLADSGEWVDTTYTTTTSSSGEAVGAAFGGIFSVVFLCVGAIILFGSIAFNIWMIVDVIKREFEQKTLWLVLLIAGFFMGFGVIVAIIYFFAVRAPMVKAEKSGGASKI